MNIAFHLPYYAFGARGASQYGENLLKSFFEVAPQDQFTAFTFFFRNFDRHAARISHLASSNVRVDLLRWPQRLLNFSELSLGYPLLDRHYLASKDFDVFHSGGTFHSPRLPTVITVHGVPWNFTHPDRHFEKFMPRILEARRLIFPSRCAMEFVLKNYPVDAKICSVIYYGVDHALFYPRRATGELQAVRSRYSLPERFLLCVGPFQFRDNIELILYSLSRNRGHRMLEGLKLVLVGGLEEHGLALKRRALELGVEESVVFTGYVPHRDLAVFYNLTELFVHPSFYEELGAQLLEASASGAPIIASRTGGIEEVLGDCALYFNPHQLEDFERTLFRALDNRSLREDIGLQIHARSQRFDWNEAARQTVEVYRQAVRR